jgi:tetratricopeptide (TPR) repeat protein
MCRIDNSSWLPASVVSAALITGSLALLAQTQTTSQTASTATQPMRTEVLPTPQPSPENVGDSLMAHHRYQAAIEAYKRASQNSAIVWNKMGIANQMLFNLPEATRCYLASLKIDPKNVNVLNNLGTVYDSQKNYKAAVKMYHRALKIDPKSALVLKNLGTDLLAQHKYEKGWEVYKQALSVDPQVFDHSTGPRVENPASVQQRGAMNYYMAKGCVRAGKNDRAIEYLRMALNEGFTTSKKLAADNEFASLRGIPAFEQLIAEEKAQ